MRSATTSRVRSSSVGPSPPVRISRSLLPSASATIAFSTSRSSPATALPCRSMPSSFSRSVMNSEFVSTCVGVSISLPTAIDFRPHRQPSSRRKIIRAAKQQIRVDGGHRVVGHHAEAAVQPFELPRRKRLDHVERAKQQEPEKDAAPTDRNHEQRDEHAHHFIDHDRAGIDASQIFFARPREDDARDTAERDDQHQIEIRDGELRAADVHRDPCRRADGAGRERKKSDVPKAADKNR